MPERVAIIGVGRAGAHLAMALQATSHSLAAILDENSHAAQQCQAACGAAVATWNSLPAGLSTIFIAVPDAAIAATAARLADTAAVTPETMVCHLSGSLPAEVLAPLEHRTRLLASCHPLQTFSLELDDRRAFFDIPMALQGDEQALLRLTRLLQELRARCFFLTRENKPLYHLACVLASNYFVGLAAMVQQILHKIDLDSLEIMSALWQSTLKHILAQGPQQALTGPVARGDVATVQKHMEEINAAFPQFIEVYRALGRQLLELVRQQPDHADVTKLEELFNDEF
jgi:predicted short-subunit dehydrogenase-like oxidoreductase (DUF2520 family)